MNSLGDAASIPPLSFAPSTARYEQARIIPARHPWRHVGSAAAFVIIASIITSVLFNPRWEWNAFAEWFFAKPVLEGLASLDDRPRSRHDLSVTRINPGHHAA
jgi:hypothetical protein